MLTGDTVCTEQSVLIKYQKADQPIYLRLCHRCINCSHMTSCFFSFFEPFTPCRLPAKQVDRHYPPTLSQTGSMPTSSGQGISFSAHFFHFFFGKACGAGLMACTGCELCYGYAVCSSCFMLAGSRRSFLLAAIKEKCSNLGTD